MWNLLEKGDTYLLIKYNDSIVHNLYLLSTNFFNYTMTAGHFTHFLMMANRNGTHWYDKWRFCATNYTTVLRGFNGFPFFSKPITAIYAVITELYSKIAIHNERKF